MTTTEEQLAKLAVGNSREVIERQAERIAELEAELADSVTLAFDQQAENERLDDHAKKWGIKAQQAEQQLTEAQADDTHLRDLLYQWLATQEGDDYATAELMEKTSAAIDAAREGE